MARHLSTYVGLAHRGEQILVESLRQVAAGHPEDPDTMFVCRSLARQHEGGIERLRSVAERYGEEDVEEPERLHADGLTKTRTGGVGLLRDLQDLYLLAALLQTTWTVLEQAGQGARNEDLLQLSTDALTQVGRTMSS